MAATTVADESVYSLVLRKPVGNDQAWAKNATTNDVGGFVYLPGYSFADETAAATTDTPLCSSGSMTYAGRKSFIYAELMKKLVTLQKADGFWQNENNRWWENDPVLCTSYSLLALNIVQSRRYP